MLKLIKVNIKVIVLKIINLIPCSSLLLGSPRKISTGMELALKNDINLKYIKSFIKQETVIERPPGTVETDVFYKFKKLYNRLQPENYILHIKNGRVWGNNGAVITSDDIFLSDVSVEFGRAKFNSKEHPLFYKLKLKPPEELKGTIAVVASPGSNIYAHWLFDILPRLIVLRKSGLFDTIDKLIINHDNLDFQRETLEKLNLENIQFINSFRKPDFHIRAENLVVPSYPNKHATVNKWVCDEVKGLFSKNNLPENSLASKFVKPNLRLYISRQNKPGRNFNNEDEVFNLLREYGFEKIQCENYSIAEKAGIFKNAEYVIGTHGSGLANVVFCKAGCKVINIFSPNYFDTFLWSLANASELQYYYFFGEGEIPEIQDNRPNQNFDITVNMDRFKQLMTKVFH